MASAGGLHAAKTWPLKGWMELPNVYTDYRGVCKPVNLA